MGFLDKLRSVGSGGVTLDVSLDPAVVRPGDDVKVRFDLGGEIDDKCQNVLVRLVGTGTYATMEQSHDYEGNYSGTEEAYNLFELHVEEQSHPVKSGANHATFTVPYDAPPSSGGWVKWEASVTVERKLAGDKSQTAELRVRRGLEGLPTERAPEHFDGLTLDGIPPTVRAGDTLSGLLTVAVENDFSVASVRIRLHEIVTSARTGTSEDEFEDVPLREIDFSSGSTRITEDRLPAELELSGARDFKAGTTEQFPFELVVPDDAGPTSGHRHTRVQLRLEALLDRHSRDDRADDLGVDIPLIVC